MPFAIESRHYHDTSQTRDLHSADSRWLPLSVNEPLLSRERVSHIAGMFSSSFL